MTQVLEMCPQVIKDLPILHGQYHGCWWPGDARSQGIKKHNIGLVKPRELGPHTLRVKRCELGSIQWPTGLMNIPWYVMIRELKYTHSQ